MNLAPPDTANQNAILFFTKNKFAGQKDDNIILLSFIDDEWRFTSFGIIIYIEHKKLKNTEQFENIIEYQITTELRSANFLRQYAYTLLRIKNLNSPINNLPRNIYLQISDPEFESISRGEIFLARTMFGKFFNALHIDHRNNFLRILLSKQPMLLFGPINYFELYNELKNYLEENIFQHAWWLRSSYELLSQILTQDQLFEIGFGTSTFRSGYDVISEHSIIRFGLGRLENDIFSRRSYIYEESSNRIQSNLQIQLNELFRNAPLPIIL